MECKDCFYLNSKDTMNYYLNGITKILHKCKYHYAYVVPHTVCAEHKPKEVKIKRCINHLCTCGDDAIEVIEWFESSKAYQCSYRSKCLCGVYCPTSLTRQAAIEVHNKISDAVYGVQIEARVEEE